MKIDKDKLKQIKKRPPIFIIGCQRSGTTFLYRTLSEIFDIGFGRDNNLFIKIHQKINDFGELTKDENLKRLLCKIYTTYDFQRRFKKLDITNEEFISAIEQRKFSDIVRTIYAYWAMTQRKSQWGGKTPDYTAHIEQLIDLFPDIKIVHIVRDGRDVFLSFDNLPWGPNDPYVAAAYWRRSVDLGSNGKRYTDKRFIEIRYEDLLETPEEVFKQLFQLLDISEMVYAKKVSKFREVTIPKIKKDNINKWKSKMTKKDIRVFELAAGEQLSRYGYEILNKDYQECDLLALTKGYHHGRNIFIKGIKGHLFRNTYRKISKRLFR